ncbi:MAG TPA: NfeD family protein [Verrucomicrobiae bacterium]|nr:NfeD family protein [Verrucomicrobiae bacterium]
MELFLVYAVCFAVGLFWALLSALVAGVFGGLHHPDSPEHPALGTGGHAEAGYNMPGFSAFSPTVLASFLCSFGGFGMIFSRVEATSSVWMSAPLALLAAMLVGGLVLWLFRQMFLRTQSSSESRVASLVGVTATVQTPIPATGLGEVTYVHGGTRYLASACSEDCQPLARGALVKITGSAGSHLSVVLQPNSKTYA